MLAAAILSTVIAAASPGVSDRPADRDTLVFSDTFDTWNPVWQPRRLSTCDSGCARVHDGEMTLSVRKQGGQYVTVQLGTKTRAEFTYGYFEVKASFPALRGVHSAAWLAPTEGYIVGQSEVDYAENMGRSAIWQNVYHRLLGMDIGEFLGERFHTDLGPGDAQTEKHVYGVDWRADRYDFYVDGRLVATTTTGLSDRPKFLVLSMKQSAWELPFFQPDRLDEYRATFYRMRVWQ